MNAPRLTDAQVSQALRAHLPDGAQPGLRERILEAAETTTQQRALPSFLGALSEADPVARRRSLLIAAALLVALALAATAAVGALRLLQRDPIQKLSLDPPPDIQAFVFSSRERLPTLPPVAMTTLDSVDGKSRVYVHRSGAVRFERYASADATEPVAYTIFSGSRMGRLMTVGTEKVWVVQDETIGDDPRVFLFAPPPGPIYIGGPVHPGGPGCDMDRDPTEVGDPAAASGWRYVGVEYVAGRPTHHAACDGGDLWIDIETRLILRSRGPLIDADHEPIPGEFRTIEATEVAFGEQPAELFDFAPPQGVALVVAEEFEAYQCARDPVCSAATPEPVPTPPEPSPTPIVGPNQSDCAVPPGDPSEPTGPLAWTQASLTEDWPAPVRPEPVGEPSVVPMPPTYIDPLGDSGSDSLACVDIRDLRVAFYDVSFDLVSNRPPDVDPTKAWIAYGVVVDDDRDGVPDWRYGIDNLPRTAGDENSHHREWRTNLHTGRTESVSGSDWASVSESFLKTGYPAEGDREGFRTGRDGARFRFGQVSDTTQGTNTYGVKVKLPFYAWASVIVDGRVVATDYAPNSGWILPSPGATPGGKFVLERGNTNTQYDLADVSVRARFGELPRISMTVPKGWDSLSHDLPGGDIFGLDLMIVDKPGLDACGSGGTALATIGPSADDLAAFLADQPKIKVSQSTDVTLDGYRGRYVEYTTTESDSCDPDNRPFWPVLSDSGGTGGYNQTWILDVDGARLVIDALSSPGASESVRAELRQIVESIHIGP